MKPGRAHAAAVGAALLALVLVSVAWLLHLRAGPKLDAWTAGPLLVSVPFVTFVMTVLWLAARAITSRWVAWRVVPVLLATALGTYAVVAATCGPLACFRQVPNRALAWFMVGGVALAALVHHFVLSRMQRGSRNGRQ